MSIQVNFQGSNGGFVPPVNFVNLLGKTVVIQSAQILTLASNPVELIPAVPGYTICPVQVLGFLNPLGAAYQTNGNLSIYFPTANKNLYYKLGTDFLFSTGFASANFAIDNATANDQQYRTSESLYLTTEFGNPTNGNGILILYILYALIA